MAKLNSQWLLDASKANDRKVVKYLRSLGKVCDLASKSADMHYKYDIVVMTKDLEIQRIDTKYTTRPATKLFYEVKKHANSCADYIWYFLKHQQMMSYLVKKDILKKLASKHKQYQVRADGDLLVDFDVNELKRGTDYWQIDMSKAFT